jgi:hypothetical protein
LTQAIINIFKQKGEGNMKKTLAVFLAIFLAIILTSPGEAKTVTVRNKSGQKLGTASTHGSKTVYRNKSGKKIGTSTKSGHTTTVRTTTGKKVDTVKHR